MQIHYPETLEISIEGSRFKNVVRGNIVPDPPQVSCTLYKIFKVAQHIKNICY